LKALTVENLNIRALRFASLIIRALSFESLNIKTLKFLDSILSDNYLHFKRKFNQKIP
jgi:hypothetical protein